MRVCTFSTLVVDASPVIKAIETYFSRKLVLWVVVGCAFLYTTYYSFNFSLLGMYFKSLINEVVQSYHFILSRFDAYVHVPQILVPKAGKTT